ncbi:hypothetical protein ACFQJ7_09655 [Halovenus rubra]|uniref:SHOCT domain-containing protein n=2 Tax=Halovenus rubra TaxID=869890 RepID=A0ABD5X515_9EURY|nr:hypothetical protein [Halovenus rubra]
MNLGKLLLWVVLGVVALAVVNVVVAAVFAAIGFLWSLITTGVTLAVVAGLLYGVYRLYDLVSGGDKGQSANSGGYDISSSRNSSLSTSTEYGGSASGVDDLQQQYANGDISEAELEQRLEQQMADDDLDNIDRELQRERR